MSFTTRMSRARTWLAACTVWASLALGSAGCKQNEWTFEPTDEVAGSAGNAGAGGDASDGGNGGGDSDGDAGVVPTEDAAAVEEPFSRLGHGLPGSEEGTWTYMVYMLGDNNLEHYLPSDLAELMTVGTGGKLTILVQVDRTAGENEQAIGGVPNFTGAKRFRVEAGRLTELADLGERNMGSGVTFSEFVTWGIQAAPADHYAVVLWDHGGAWGRFGADASAQGDGLSLAELSGALDASIATTGLRGPLDLVGFDACLMGTWEVAVALEGRASYLLASEEVEPGHGWDHSPISILRNGATPVQLGTALINGYAAQARTEGTFARLTLSLTNVNRISYVTEGIDRLVQHLSEGGVNEHATAVGQSRAAVGAFGTVPRGSTASMVDIQRWAVNLAASDPDSAADVEVLELELAKAVVDRVAGDAYPGVGGLSIYFPIVDTRYQGTYDELAGVDAWRDFLSDFHAAAATGAGDPPSFTNTDGLATLGIAQDGVTVTGNLAEGTYGDIASTTLDFGLYGIDGSAFFLGQKPASITNDGVVRGIWDLKVLQISQGDLTDYASYVDDQSAASGVHGLSLPLHFVHDGDVTTVVLMLAVDPFGGVLSQRYYHHLDGAWAEFTPPSGSTFSAIVPTLAPGTNAVTDQPQATTFDGNAPVSIRFVSLAAGSNVFVRLQATDYAGQSSSLDGAGTL